MRAQRERKSNMKWKQLIYWIFCGFRVNLLVVRRKWRNGKETKKIWRALGTGLSRV